jgi:translation initiation factor 3 subunit D
LLFDSFKAVEFCRRLLLENENVGTVFATDAILATLMCSPRSMYSWDIVVQKVGNKLFFDKRDASFDLLTVSHNLSAIF